MRRTVVIRLINLEPIVETVVQAGIPMTLPLLFCKTPDAFRTYQRLRGEATVRAAISLPLVVLTVVAAREFSEAWQRIGLVVLGLVFSLALFAIAVHRLGRAYQLIAEEVSQRLAENATIQALSRQLLTALARENQPGRFTADTRAAARIAARIEETQPAIALKYYRYAATAGHRHARRRAAVLTAALPPPSP
ncbi:hypothetical protein [Fodinicola acaciae]|uniref:hypothetical protein n=1 Tax=Fodinicola acaciae TaxID=2681555 RepID=UPI0013D5BF12|nr:hypothetical protein [Fodinicola acaciae]